MTHSHGFDSASTHGMRMVQIIISMYDVALDLKILYSLPWLYLIEPACFIDELPNEVVSLKLLQHLDDRLHNHFPTP